MNRLRELDFLRGIAILLVLLGHTILKQFPSNFSVGWIGVDLFFVLSGFLVSGLLFKEYLKFGNIKPILFLIRRGFKIYPIYYLSFIFYLIPILIKENLNVPALLSELIFVQNYALGFGYTNPANWSLAVEEHFYFGLTLFLAYLINIKRLEISKGRFGKFNNFYFPNFILFILIACLGMRLVSNFVFPAQYARNYTMTHLRMDSLFFGVLISYLYYFKNTLLKKWFVSREKVLLLAAAIGLLVAPRYPLLESYFVRTIGFSLLYLSFGIILLFVLLKENINKILNNLFSSSLVNFVSKIGYCSYSIYIFHLFVIDVLHDVFIKFNIHLNAYLNILTITLISIAVGMISTYKIEKFFLALRDKYYPSRIN